MIIKMEVEVLCEKCQNCPQLEILDEQNDLYSFGKIYCAEHHLRCANLYRCEATKAYLTGGEQLKMKEVEDCVNITDPLDNRSDSIRDLHS